MLIGEAELIREFQKGRTADRRLEQAAEQRKDLEAETARIAGERAEWERTRTQAASAKTPEGSPDDSQATPIGDAAGEAAEIYNALVSGDEDAAVAAITKLTKGRQADAIPPEQIAVRVRQQIKWEDAQGAFCTEFKDIMADPLLRQIASNTLTETLKTSQSYDQAFREAGNRTRAWARGVGGGSEQAGGGKLPTDPGLAEKQARKERIDEPTVISARAAGKPQDKVASTSEVIKEMRAQRGLPT